MLLPFCSKKRSPKGTSSLENNILRNRNENRNRRGKTAAEFKTILKLYRNVFPNLFLLANTFGSHFRLILTHAREFGNRFRQLFQKYTNRILCKVKYAKPKIWYKFIYLIYFSINQDQSRARILRWRNQALAKSRLKAPPQRTYPSPLHTLPQSISLRVSGDFGRQVSGNIVPSN